MCVPEVLSKYLAFFLGGGDYWGGNLSSYDCDSNLNHNNCNCHHTDPSPFGLRVFCLLLGDGECSNNELGCVRLHVFLVVWEDKLHHGKIQN